MINMKSTYRKHRKYDGKAKAKKELYNYYRKDFKHYLKTKHDRITKQERKLKANARKAGVTKREHDKILRKAINYRGK